MNPPIVYPDYVQIAEKRADAARQNFHNDPTPANFHKMQEAEKEYRKAIQEAGKWVIG